MRLDHTAAGVFPIAPTAFHPDGRIDEASTDRLIETYLAAGSTGVTVLGIMGEAPKLEPEESLAIATRFIKGMKNLPVIVGVSAPGFAAMRSLARASMDRGAAGVMIAPVPSLRTDDQITGYYRQAIEAIGDDIPFVIQDYPLTLSVQMTPKVIRQIVQDHPSCVMLKHEDWPGLEKIKLFSDELLAVCSKTYLKEAGPLRRPADLQKAVLLKNAIQPWKPWFKQAGLDWPEPEHGPSFSDSSLALQAAADGHGVALGRRLLVEHMLAQGTLVQLFDVRALIDEAFYVVYLEETLQRPEVVAFVDWIKAAAADKGRPSPR